MLKGWQEGAQNWYKISFSCSVFLQPAFSFFFFSPPWLPAATTDLATVLTTKHRIPSITQQPHHRPQYPSFPPSPLYKNLLLCHRDSDSLHTDSRGSNHLAQKLSSTPTSSNRSNSSFLSHTNRSSRELSFSSAGICSCFFQPGLVHACRHPAPP